MNALTIQLPLQEFTGPVGSIHIIIPFLTVLPIILFFIYYTILAVKLHQKMYFLLACLFFVSLLNHLFTIGVYFGPGEYSNQIFKLAQIMEYSALYSTVLLFQLFEENTLGSKTQSLFSIIYAVLVYAIFTGEPLVATLEDNQIITRSTEITPQMIIIAIFSLTATVWLLKTYRHNRLSIKNKDQIKFVNRLFIGIILTHFLGAFTPTIVDLSNSNMQVFISGNFAIVRNFGLIIIGFSFLIIKNKPWLLQRQKNHFMIIYSKTGIPLYTKSFHSEIDDMGMNLLSGAFTAITAIFQESANVADPIEAILFQGKQLRVIEKPSFFCMLMVDYITPTSKLAYQEFTQKVEELFGNIIPKFNGDTLVFKSLDEWVGKYFS